MVIGRELLYIPEKGSLSREDHLQRIALALARDATAQEMAETVTRECQEALGADAICTFLKKDADHLKMVSQFGCTPQFIEQFGCLKLNSIPYLDNCPPEGMLYIGSADDFKKVLPGSEKLVENSGRKLIGYAPFIVEGQVMGLLGFSYSEIPKTPVDRSYVLLLVNLCGQALERARLSELEKSANRAKTDFLANISHEIRTPLGLIQGYIDLLLESDGLNDTQKTWASIVQRNSRQLIELIGEVLDISKIEAEKVELKQEVIALRDFISDLRQTAALRAYQKSLALEITHAQLPEFVVTDRTRVRQILLNLIGNAIKFTSTGSIRVHFAMEGEDCLVVDVSDQGMGIDPSYHEHIFEPFAQVLAGNRPKSSGGTGLGLPISRMWARALGGDLKLVRSNLGEGSTFRLAFRVRIPEPHEIPERTSPPSPLVPKLRELTGIEILLVEDSEDNRDLVSSLLRSRGAKVEMATSGAEALEMAFKARYDVILMDIQMPDMDGHQTLAELRARGYMRPVAALTAHALQSERERAMSEGFNAYLTKPIEIQALCQTLKELAAH